MEWIKQAKAITTRYPDLSFDLPNTHLLIELLLRALPTLKSMQFCRSGRFESHHVMNKQKIKQVSHNVGTKPEMHALKHAVTVDALRFMFQGGRWGTNLEYQLGSKLKALHDPRPGKEHLAHPLLHTLIPNFSVIEKVTVSFLFIDFFFFYFFPPFHL
jgi:hypothetical protein